MKTSHMEAEHRHDVSVSVIKFGFSPPVSPRGLSLASHMKHAFIIPSIVNTEGRRKRDLNSEVIMVRVSGFCCGANLKAGCFIIAALNVLGSVGQFAISGLVPKYVDDGTGEPVIGSRLVLGLNSIPIVIGVANLVAACFLLYGT